MLMRGKGYLMLPRRIRKRHQRVTVGQRWPQPIINYLDVFMDAERKKLEAYMEELKVWCVEQIRLRDLDDNGFDLRDRNPRDG